MLETERRKISVRKDANFKLLSRFFIFPQACFRLPVISSSVLFNDIYVPDYLIHFNGKDARQFRCSDRMAIDLNNSINEES